MKLIVGLGNPDKQYNETRHNAGRSAIAYLAKKENFGEFQIFKKLESAIAQKNKVILALPQTFMNDSGRAVKKLKNYFKVPPENIFIIHDDADLPLGELRISQGSGAAGHQGVASIIKSLATKNFIRYRMGIKTKVLAGRKRRLENFVLQKFPPTEKKIMEKVIAEVAGKISLAFLGNA